MIAAELDPWSIPTYPERIALALSLLDTHRCAFPACARVITTTVGILRNDTPGQSGAQDPEIEQGEVENQHVPEVRVGARTTAPGRLAPSLSTNGADPMMVAPPEHVHADCRERHAEDAATIRRLRTDLARAVSQRARHYFVDDGQGYCLACALPAANARHSERAA